MYHTNTIGVVIPAHNEEESITQVVSDLLALDGLVDCLVVCNNASSDNTASLAREAGAIVVDEPRKGYGAACLRGISALPGVDWIVFLDGDNAMLASDLPRLLIELHNGADLVIGSRTLGDARGEVEPGAMTPHQRGGNWLAARLLNALWPRPSGVTDLGPFRAITRSALARLGMADQAYGWTVEMQAKALAAELHVTEVPVGFRRRLGTSKVSGTWRGSWGAGIGILSTIAKIGGQTLWAQLARSLKIESQPKDSMWKKPY